MSTPSLMGRVSGIFGDPWEVNFFRNGGRQSSVKPEDVKTTLLVGGVILFSGALATPSTLEGHIFRLGVITLGGLLFASSVIVTYRRSHHT